jgi:hypothetical protein
LGFFFFLRIAVATSSSCEKVSYLLDGFKRSDITNVLDLGAGRVAVNLSASLLAGKQTLRFVLEMECYIRQVDLLMGVLVRLGSHDDYLDASVEADAGSVMTKGGGAVSIAEKSQAMAFMCGMRGSKSNCGVGGGICRKRVGCQRLGVAGVKAEVRFKIGDNEGSSCSKATGHLPPIGTAVDSDSLADRHSCGPMISPNALNRGGTMILQG